MEQDGEASPAAKVSLWVGFLMGFGFAAYLGYDPGGTQVAAKKPTEPAPETPVSGSGRQPASEPGADPRDADASAAPQAASSSRRRAAR